MDNGCGTTTAVLIIFVLRTFEKLLFFSSNDTRKFIFTVIKNVVLLRLGPRIILYTATTLKFESLCHYNVVCWWCRYNQ